VRDRALAAVLLVGSACAPSTPHASLANLPKADRKHEEERPMRVPIQMPMNVEGDGRAMVLVGGGLTGWLSWIPHQERLRGSRRVGRAQLLAVQFGLEDRPLPESYSVQLESRALGVAIDGMQREGAVDLVAWSYGALVSLDYALGHPARVRTLTLIEPPAFWVLEATGRMDERSRQERDELEALHREMRGDVTEAQLARFVVQAALCPPDRRPEELAAWPLWVKHRRSLRNGPALFAHRDDAERLRAFERPVLLVKGTGSSHFLHRIIDALEATLPRAEVIELPGGHAPQIAALDDFLARVRSFQAPW
jgi:pimeloyl-ACP methyl ester carboxylesterase